ncbi:TPA: hypothetical protein DF272_04520 [Candidatus Falkowbacteria bacterium]|nr:hypothetical protein [Candidatus Falkowbacteria bacterium]
MKPVPEWLQKFVDAGGMFVRSQDEMCIHDPKTQSNATGLLIPALVAWNLYGERLAQIFDEDQISVILVCERTEPAETLRRRREFLNLTVSQVAMMARVEPGIVAKADSITTRSSIHDLVKIAMVLGLNPHYIAVKKGNPENGYLYDE